jgi:hypothetical protein
MRLSTLKLASAVALTGFALAACSGDESTSESSNGPRFSTAAAGYLEVCKYSVELGSTAIRSDIVTGTSIDVQFNGGGIQTATLPSWDGVTGDHCRSFQLPAGATEIKVTEKPNSGTALYFYREKINNVEVPGSPFYANSVAAPFLGEYTITWNVTNPGTEGYNLDLKNVVVEPSEEDEGCTLTIGYWKTHSEKGPAPYDDTWAELPNGADTPFFLSGQTWYEVFETAPGGNAYYQLAHQYMGAKLNILNGASTTPAVVAAIADAEVLFNTYTPAQVGAWKGTQGARAQFISLAGTLGHYNEGLIGPGHCE